MKQAVLLLGAAILLVLLGVSCADETAQPPGPASPDFVRITSPEPPNQELGTGGQSSNRMHGILGDTEVSVWVKASVGGVVALGRYALVIAPGALPRDTMITLRSQEQGGTVGCELLPQGLVFNTPAYLFMALNGTDFDADDPITIYWYNEAADIWVDTHGTFIPDELLVFTKLAHFSQYQAGRAGW